MDAPISLSACKRLGERSPERSQATEEVEELLMRRLWVLAWNFGRVLCRGYWPLRGPKQGERVRKQMKCP